MPSARMLLLLVALVAAPVGARAQTVMGTITGHIRDASGGVLPGVTITMTQLETSHKASAVTDGEGRFTSGPLPLGTYRLDAVLSGFKSSVRSGITLTINEIARVDFTLEVGTLEEVVEVAAGASLVDASTSSV